MTGLTVSRTETSPSIAAIVAAVDAEFPDCRSQTSPEGMVTVVFTDIEASTEMLETLGEGRWLDVMFRHNRIVRGCESGNHGEVVKSAGDGFMLTFASARAALGFAIELQRVLERDNVTHPEEQLRVRVGMHTGNIFATEEDFLGRAVVLAARITGHARGGEILVSAACREYTRQAGGWRYGHTAELALKGLLGVERVYALEWAPEA